MSDRVTLPPWPGPYRPPWYPADAPHPWTADPATMQSGQETYYGTWCKSLAPGELERLIREHRG